MSDEWVRNARPFSIAHYQVDNSILCGARVDFGYLSEGDGKHLLTQSKCTRCMGSMSEDISTKGKHYKLGDVIEWADSESLPINGTRIVDIVSEKATILGGQVHWDKDGAFGKVMDWAAINHWHPFTVIHVPELGGNK